MKYKVTEFFQFTQPLQPHYGHGAHLASNRNKYQKFFWGWSVAGA
jgi:hypothetical protein